MNLKTASVVLVLNRAALFVAEFVRGDDDHRAWGQTSGRFAAGSMQDRTVTPRFYAPPDRSGTRR